MQQQSYNSAHNMYEYAYRGTWLQSKVRLPPESHLYEQKTCF